MFLIAEVNIFWFVAVFGIIFLALWILGTMFNNKESPDNPSDDVLGLKKEASFNTFDEHVWRLSSNATRRDRRRHGLARLHYQKTGTRIDYDSLSDDNLFDLCLQVYMWNEIFDLLNSPEYVEYYGEDFSGYQNPEAFRASFEQNIEELETQESESTHSSLEGLDDSKEGETPFSHSIDSYEDSSPEAPTQVEMSVDESNKIFGGFEGDTSDTDQDSFGSDDGGGYDSGSDDCGGGFDD